MFKINNKLNPIYTINIKELTIETGCRVFSFDTLEELLNAIDILLKEIKEVEGGNK